MHTLQVTYGTLFTAAMQLLLGCVHDRASSIVGRLERELSATQRVVTRRLKTFEVLGREVLRVKIVDDTTGIIRELTIDMKNSTLVAYEQLRSEARSAQRQQHGFASPDLVERLSQGALAEIIVDVEVATVQDVDGLKREIEGLDLLVVATHRRIITVRGTTEQIRKIARMNRVTAVAPHHERRNLSFGVARELDQPSVAGAHTLGVGSGFAVAVWEIGACIRRDHRDFSSLTFEPRFGGSDCSIFNQAGHSTSVAGVLAADRGSLGTAGLFQGRMFDVDARMAEAEDDMWARNPQIVNASFTISRFDARDVDRTAYETGLLVFNGSGNNAADEANCYAFNALCVGAYLDMNTIGVFEDDTVWLGQSFLNDRYNQREYPQVVGPSVVRQTAGMDGNYVSDSGTSYSSPGVAALAALLLAHQPFLLLNRPALMRAILMTSAQAHPILHEGRRIPIATDNIDDRAGVGAPNGFRAKSIVDDRTFLYKFVTPGVLGMQTSFPVERNERVRVVLAWDQCPGYDIFDPDLTVDLDLAVKTPNHLGFPFPTKVTHTNPSFSDNWEVVEFVALASGTVEVIVSASRFETCVAENNLARAPMAIAWTKEAAVPVVKPARGAPE
jgi:hypothetical protein